MQTYSAFDEDFVHNGLLHEKIAVEEKHVEKKSNKVFFVFFFWMASFRNESAHDYIFAYWILKPPLENLFYC